MATKMNIALALVALLAATLPGSIAQTTHVVGDSLGWTIPPGGAAAYTTWANSQTFAVGDILVFNFTTGSHSVDEVTRSAYDACTTTGPISTTTTGPARITLTTAGEHFYLCPFTGHCTAGQKLGINVSAATPAPVPEPIPAPATPVPEPTPAPVPAPAPAPMVPVPAPSPVPTSSPVPAPAPSATGSTPPSSVDTPPPSSSTTPPPPPSSAPSFAGAALPISLLAVAIAFFF